jgi:hypothetical protein
VLLNHGEPADPFVICESLIFGRNKTIRALGTVILQGLDPKMTVEQKKFASFVTIPNDDRWLYDADLADGR